MKERVSCDTTFLKNNSKFYYQYNCDSVWLTLENENNKKNIIFSMGSELYEYTYRLGFQLTKEFNKTLLFRTGCPANGPCTYILVDKETGKEIKQFGELIFNSEDTDAKFIVYFSDNTFTSITLNYIDTGKKYKIKVPSKRFNGIMVIAEQQFDEAKIEKDKLILTYRYKLSYEQKEWSIDKITIDLKKYGS